MASSDTASEAASEAASEPEVMSDTEETADTETEVRRHSEPIIIKQLWAAINYIRQQKQIANMDRICKFMLREYVMGSDEVERHLQQAVDDKLIDSYTAVAFKGANVGMEQEGFRIPDVTTLRTEDKVSLWQVSECFCVFYE